MSNVYYTKGAQKTSIDTHTPIKGKGLILVVDDDRSIRITSKCLLETLGYRVMLASDGKEALEKFENSSETIAMVILDLKMPIMNGDETFFHLRKIDPQCKAIIVSGHHPKQLLAELFEKGLKGFIEKPLHVLTLSQLVHEVLSDAL